MKQEIEGSYNAETPVNAKELTDMAKNVDELEKPRIPENDPLQNSAKQCNGLGQNAYSTTSRYLPGSDYWNYNGNVSNTYKGSIAIHPCKTAEDYAIRCLDMAYFALDTYKTEIPEGSMVPPAYLHGIVNTMCEKFGFKAGIVEDTVANVVENHTDLEKMAIDIEDVAHREKEGHDLVFTDKSGNEVTIQVKTGGEAKKNADYLAKVDMKMDSCEIEIEITT
jgi:hypothetical protein